MTRQAFLTWPSPAVFLRAVPASHVVDSAAAAHRLRGRAVQVDPINSTVKAPGTTRLKLKYGKLLSSFAFKFNLSRYIVYFRIPFAGRGLHSFPFQLKLSSSVHRITRSNSLMCPGVAQVEL